MTQRLFWICLAGALGTGARYLIGIWSAQRFGTAFPYGTLIVNVAGCFAIALVLQLAVSVSSFPPTLRLALTTGFMGGLTTYSSFAHETTSLFRAGSSSAALAYFAITTIVCLTAVLLGSMAARAIAP